MRNNNNKKDLYASYEDLYDVLSPCREKMKIFLEATC